MSASKALEWKESDGLGAGDIGNLIFPDGVLPGNEIRAAFLANVVHRIVCKGRQLTQAWKEETDEWKSAGHKEVLSYDDFSAVSYALVVLLRLRQKRQGGNADEGLTAILARQFAPGTIIERFPYADQGLASKEEE